MDPHPPPYSSERRHPRWTLPSYSSVASAGPSTSNVPHSPYQSAHRYFLGSRAERPWITLDLRSRSPSANVLPLFYENDVIVGSVSLDLTKPDAIREVSVTLQAAASTSGGQTQEMFLEIPQALFSQTSGKMHGKHSWPFSITLPREVTVGGQSMPSSRTYSLPPRFSEPGSPAHINYRIVATVRRHMFAVNSSVSTNFVYIPRSTSKPPSALREVAYREGTPIPGPNTDPEGWKTLPPVDIKGRLFSARAVFVQCMLAIAAPLSFAVNTPIPLILTLSGNDRVAVDLLSDPRAIVVRLVRTLTVGDTSAAPSRLPSGEIMGQAVFWPASGDNASAQGVKRLSGELHVRKRMTPSFDFDRIAIRYDVVLYPFQAPGFAPEVPADQALISEEVKVTVRNFPGIQPRSYAPPGVAIEAEGSSQTPHPRIFYAGGVDIPNPI